MAFIDFLYLAGHIVGELGGIVLILLALVIAGSSWRKSKNPTDLLALALFVSVAVAIIYTGARMVLIELGIVDSSFFIKIGLLDLGDLMTVIIGSLYLWFVLYLYRLKIIYSLPIVTGFFFAVYGIATNDMAPIFQYLIWTMGPSTVVLFINAIRNKQGLSFSLGILAVAVILVAVVQPSTILSYLIKWFTGVNIILGQNGFWDEKVFYDRAKRKQIQNVWIARMTTSS